MPFPIQRYNASLPQHGVLKEAFSGDEIERIVFLEKILEFNKGRVGGIANGNDVNEEARKSDVAFMQPDDNTHWIFERLASVIPRVNYDLFMLDIEVIETIQYTIYTEGQHYDWHLDSHAHWLNYERKISGSVLLTDPDEYEGGELEIITTGSPDKSILLKPQKGEIAFFASNMPHRVKPVTEGVRRSLVFWVQGKREC